MLFKQLGSQQRSRVLTGQRSLLGRYRHNYRRSQAGGLNLLGGRRRHCQGTKSFSELTARQMRAVIGRKSRTIKAWSLLHRLMGD